jgi:LmbE family N-acetylglucosaminyl deacetylase
MSKNILVLAPHTDDGELGAGGSIAKFVESGDKVFYCAFSIAEEAIPDGLPKDILLTEVKEAIKRLGIPSENLMINRFPVRRFREHRQEILDIMAKLKSERIFDLVLMPSLHDVHQDHQVIAEEAIRAFRHTSILSYELPWNNLSFQNTCFIHLQKSQVDKKIFALQGYQSQSHRPYMSAEFIQGLAKTRGVQINAEYAEVFEVIRWVIK